ncbi:MAG TPA: EsaB/YukD family protein, partial [Thermopolyspora sp.]
MNPQVQGFPPPGILPQHALASPRSAAVPSSLCRVTVVAPRRKADLALPADIPLPHVLPSLLRALGEVSKDPVAAYGWVLQRPGG